MVQITVTAKIDGGTHLKYGEIRAGQQYTIDEEDFGEQLFHRPPGFESPPEKADRERREAVEREAAASETPATVVETHCNASLPDPPLPNTSDTPDHPEEVN